MTSDLAPIFGEGFDVDSVEAQVDYVPPGKYPTLIELAELNKTKSQTGYYIKLVLSILDGPHKNRKLFVNINIVNPNQQCVDIGLRTLASLGKALGIKCIKNLDQVLNQTVVAHARVKNEQNEVNSFSSGGSNAIQFKPPGVASAPTVSTPGTALPAQEAPSVPLAGKPQSSQPPWQRPPVNQEDIPF